MMSSEITKSTFFKAEESFSLLFSFIQAPLILFHYYSHFRTRYRTHGRCVSCLQLYIHIPHKNGQFFELHHNRRSHMKHQTEPHSQYPEADIRSLLLLDFWHCTRRKEILKLTQCKI